MSIEATCAECSRQYTLKDELAGKKIRCKSCSAVITVPAAKKSVKKSDDEFPLDDDLFQGSDDELDDEEDYPRRTKKPEKKTPKKKKKSGSGGSILGSMTKIVGGVIGFIVAFVVVGNIVRIALSGSNWKPYDVPGAPGCTIDFPRATKSKTDNAGNPVIFADGYGFACAAMSEPMNPVVEPIFANLAANKGIIEMGLSITLPKAKVQGSNVITFQGRQAIDVTLKADKANVIKRAFVANGRVITLDFISNGLQESQKERFFNSFKATGSGPSPIAPANAAPASPQNPMSPHNPVATNSTPQNSLPPKKTPTNANPAPLAQPVNVETPANMLVPDTAVDPNAPPNVRRTAWRYVDAPTVLEGQKSNAGVFLKKLGDNWVEQRKRASTTYWNETARTTDYIELMKTDRSLFVRLYEDRSEYRLGTETEFKSLFPGKWE